MHTLVAALEQVGQPFLAQELSLMKCLQYDGDLTGLPVSNTSKTYPNAAFGHMSDERQLGIPGRCRQSFKKPHLRPFVGFGGASCWRYRFSVVRQKTLSWLREKRTGQRHLWRTELLEKRIEAFVKTREPAEKRYETQKVRLASVSQAHQEVLEQLKTAREAPEPKPKHIETLKRRGVRREKGRDSSPGKTW